MLGGNLGSLLKGDVSVMNSCPGRKASNKNCALLCQKDIYTASKVKHHLNIFLEKTVKLSKYELILVTCLKRDKVVTIYSNF